ncbi:acetate--CoA ligase family protein [bacterium]|nr:acetate--CoA ligase family protein [bacterium]
MALLSFKKTKQLLKKYKIGMVKTEIVDSKEKLLFAAKKLGFPLAIKISSPKIIHKTEKKLVITYIKNKNELLNGFYTLIKNSKGLDEIEGILVQKMATGTELICGAKKDDVFGPVIMFGLGGIFVEVLKDISFRIAPIKNSDAMDMIKEIKAYKILTGYRNHPAVNIKKVAEMLKNLSLLSLENKAIKAIDFNPVFADKNKVEVVDAKILI